MVPANLRPQLDAINRNIAQMANFYAGPLLADLDSNSRLAKAISRMKPETQALLRSNWRPFESTGGGYHGLGLRVRDIEAQQLDTPQAKQQVTNTVTKAVYDAIMFDPQAFLQPVLQDALTAEKPHFSIAIKTTDKKKPEQLAFNLQHGNQT